jgi:hypothetical protein
LDLEAAQRFFLRSFQEGKFGQWTLDDLLGDEVCEGDELLVDGAAVQTVSEDGLQTPDPIVSTNPPPIPSSENLTARVSNRVKSFLDDQARQQARRSEGIAESATQEKKQELAKVKAERQAKWDAKAVRKRDAGALTSRSGSRSSAQARRR